MLRVFGDVCQQLAIDRVQAAKPLQSGVALLSAVAVSQQAAAFKTQEVQRQGVELTDEGDRQRQLNSVR